ncbi:MAG: hypothetical protein HS110_10445 [Zoogloeaceae bacterium]|nr:hypothetical protein [Zoogloeaceae bacterium]
MRLLAVRMALVATALLAADLLGWLVIFRTEGATILCGLALVLISRSGWAGMSPFLPGLGASLMFAGGFDWMDWGPATPSGDWLAGFFVGALIFLPGPFLLWCFPPEEEKKKPTDALIRFSGIATLILGSLLWAIARNPESSLSVYADGGWLAWGFWIGLAVSLLFQFRQRSFNLRTLALDLALALLFALALAMRQNSMRACLLFMLIPFGLAAWASFWPTSRAPELSRAKTASAITMLFLPWLAILWFGTMGIIGSLYNLEVVRMVAWHEPLVNLSRESFAWLVMRDVYLWHDKLPGSPLPAGSASELVRKMRVPEDRFSDVHPFETEQAIRKGWGVRLRRTDNADLQVAYVIPNSPAARAGVQRGWRVIRPDPGAQQAVFIDHSGQRLVVPIGEIDDRVFLVQLLPEAWGGAAVGYMHLPQFDERYLSYLRNAFLFFKNHGIGELVIDLRGNPGGGADMVVALASLVVGESKRGAVFSKDRINGRYTDISRESEDLKPTKDSLNLSRIFVLTNDDTCSASELFISGMRRFAEVVVIGETTCGKPFGFRSIDYRGLTYDVISFAVQTSQGRGDYVNGIEPTCRVMDDFNQPMGSLNDPLVTAARDYVMRGRFNSCP